MKTSTATKGYIIRSTAYATLLLCVILAVCSAFDLSGKLSEPRRQSRTLTLADRVAYQRAIEEVYWRHRIWPKENAGPKPLLDEVMSQDQIQKKVEDYLSKSQVLENYWHRPISPDDLQTEMDRMAKDTKQPEVLGELFAALDNDPFVIAECLARPLLAKRMVINLHDYDKAASDSPLSGEDRTGRQTTAQLSNYKLPERVEGGCLEDTWRATSTTNAPDGRTYHTAISTGVEMIVWGGFSDAGLVNTGGRYDAATDSWTPTSTINAPDARYVHTAVWTGTEMIVWAGQTDNFPLVTNSGGRYNPSTDSWTATSTTNAPEARYVHTAVWSGSEMIVWGGAGETFSVINTGGRYNPDTDSWIATDTTNAPEARSGQTAVWTGTAMIVWGGEDDNLNSLNTGARYEPDTDSWIATSISNAPTARVFHTGVWTGSEMIVWGGYDGAVYLNTGGRYNSSIDSWTATNTTNPPDARSGHTVVWTGSEMIVWGGGESANFFNTGGRYDPSTDIWTATNSTNAPEARILHTAVLMESEMIVWGGRDESFTRFNTGGRYCVGEAGPTPSPTATVSPTATPRVTPRPRPMPHPRPTPR
ncbi:MAG TPA: hypothetical protein VFA51_13275 [Candidatus Udaeobacter sp.]|nr:hypothetical protein [Candidatus Udaeobacter sp.]